MSVYAFRCWLLHGPSLHLHANTSYICRVRFAVFSGWIWTFLFCSFCAAPTCDAGANPGLCTPKKQNVFRMARSWPQLEGRRSTPHHQLVPAGIDKKYRPHHGSMVQISHCLTAPALCPNYFIAYTSPSYLSLKRRLLFPNHYFW